MLLATTRWHGKDEEHLNLFTPAPTVVRTTTTTIHPLLTYSYTAMNLTTERVGLSFGAPSFKMSLPSQLEHVRVSLNAFRRSPEAVKLWKGHPAVRRLQEGISSSLKRSADTQKKLYEVEDSDPSLGCRSGAQTLLRKSARR
ncbi:hypothetical protein PIIN_09255 [Serendipita indica DSM 11827]|uniref:Uncharacterized protein n=1 Tax=Serendipita indica (strain DSM 11827) TaxID=1109443 RepID=G4TVC8_SERID|nr:hypothetical protein PIIN_09255 [Serendipita indica DSM 11827]